MFSKKVFSVKTSEETTTNKDGQVVVTRTVGEVSSGGRDNKVTKTVTTYSTFTSSTDSLPKDFDNLKLSFDAPKRSQSEQDKQKFFKCITETNHTTQQSPAMNSSTVNGTFAQKSPSKTSPSSRITPEKFREECLKTHNEYRAKHGTPPLKLSKKLCDYAQEWADHLAQTDSFKHRSEHKYGENIYTKWSSDPNHSVPGNEAVDSWYSEIKDHTFGREPTSLKSGHFTQVIWRESKEMGVAFARSRSGRILVVANYDPPGNFIGTFTANVPAPNKGGCCSQTRVPTQQSAPSVTSSPTKGSPAFKPSGNFTQDCLKVHNEYRSKHGTPPLALSKKLCSYAQEWADHLAKTDSFQHRQEHKYGENIFMKWSSDPNHQVTGNEPVDSWYSEIKDHVFGREPSSLKSGHFTQVIWRESKEMGVAFGRSRSGKILVVANYDPPGNLIGSFAKNVPSPKK